MLGKVKTILGRVGKSLSAFGALLAILLIPPRLQAAAEWWSPYIPSREVLLLVFCVLLIAWLFWIDFRPTFRAWWGDALEIVNIADEHAFTNYRVDMTRFVEHSEFLLTVKNKTDRTLDDVTMRVLSYRGMDQKSMMGLGYRLTSVSGADAITLHPGEVGSFILVAYERTMPPPRRTVLILGNERQNLRLPQGQYYVRIGFSARDVRERSVEASFHVHEHGGGMGVTGVKTTRTHERV